MKTRKLLLLALSAIALVGCMKSEIDEATINSSNAISFETSADKLTKAAVLDESNVTTYDFGLYAYYTGQVAFSDYDDTLSEPNFMNDQLVEYTDGAWSYSPLKYWPNATNDMISFFGYLPKSTNVVGQTNATGELPIISFSQKVANPLNMIDLTVAQVLDQTKTTSAVDLPFQHILTRLNFAAKTDETLDAGTTIEVTALRILGTANSAGTTNPSIDNSGENADSRFYSAANYQFTTDEDASGWDYSSVTPTQVATAMDLSKILDSSNEISSTVDQTSLFTTAQYLFLIPPHGKDGVESENDLRFQIEYTVTTKDTQLASNNIETSKTAHFSMPNGSLVEGKAYNAIVTISLDAVKVTATPEDWGTEEDAYTVTAGEAQSAAEIETAITTAYSGTADALTVTYKQNPDDALNITIPDPDSGNADLNIYLDLPYQTGEVTITTNSNYTGELTINAPNATVTVNGGTYTNLTVWTYTNTLIIADDATVDGLTIEKGSVVVYGELKGDVVKSSTNTEATIITVMEDATYSGSDSIDGVTITKISDLAAGVYYSIDGGSTYTVFSYNNSNFSLPDGDYTEVKVITVGDDTIANSASAKLFAKSGLTKIDLGDAKFASEAWSAYSTSSQTTLQTLILPKEGITSYTSHFQGYTALTHIELPEGPTSLVTKMFWRCSSLEEITLPQSVVTFEGEWTFRGCSKLKKINVENITTWSTLALRECGFEDQSEIVLNESVTELPSSFLAYNPIKSFVVPEHITIIGAMAFGGCTEMTSITLHDGITSIGSSAFTGCTSIGDIDIPENDEFTILNTSFCYNWAALKTVTIPDNVTELGYLAFAYSGLEGAFTIPSQIKFSDPGYNRQFQSCTGLTSIKIEASENEITLPLRIFNGCAALESLDIPSNVIATADYLLYSNKMMNTIICRATTPPTTMSNDFGGISSTGVNYYVGALATGDKILYVPDGSVDAYNAKATDGTDNIVETLDGEGNITSTNENYWKTVLIDVCGFEVKPLTDLEE